MPDVNDEFTNYLKDKELPELINIKDSFDKENEPEKYQLLLDQINYINKIDQSINGEEFKIIGFWLRLLTDILDAIILGVIGFIISIPFRNILYGVGENGAWIGLLITFFYTGILQSYIGKGQSIAKKIFKIEVLSINGKFLSLQKSFLRYTVIALIFYNGWISTSITSMIPFLNNSIFSSVFSVIMIFLYVGGIVLLIFHPLKRGIHDIIAGSIVIKKGCYDSIKLKAMNSIKKAKKAYIVSGIFAIALIILSFSFYLFPKNQSLNEVAGLYNIISTQSNLTSVSVNHNTFKSSDNTTKSINIIGFMKKIKFDNNDIKEKEKKDVIQLVLENYNNLSQCDKITLTIRTGFNIGIASSYSREISSYNNDGTEIK